MQAQPSFVILSFTMRSLLSLCLLNLAIAPVLSAATTAAKGGDKGGKKEFDVKALSLREVGARNTLVSVQQ